MLSIDENPQYDLLTLRHGKVNALDIEFLQALRKQLKISGENGKALLITGSGSSFSAGVDLIRLVKEGAPYVKQFLPELSGLCTELFTFPHPVVAAINGHAIAGGCIMAFACDVRVGSEAGGKFGAAEFQVGVPFPTAPLEILRFGAANNFEEMVYTGRLFNPKQAYERGLLHELELPENLLPKSISKITMMSNVDRDVYRLAKEELRRETLLRIQNRGAEIDPTVMDMWCSKKIIDTIASYLETLKK